VNGESVYEFSRELNKTHHRYATFQKCDDLIKTSLGYEEFTKGYEYYGFNVRKNGDIVYREWAPNAITASLVGDFSKYIRTFKRDDTDPFKKKKTTGMRMLTP
jgi:1,4-alpha-glucan branching enzyme